MGGGGHNGGEGIMGGGGCIINYDIINYYASA